MKKKDLIPLIGFAVVIVVIIVIAAVNISKNSSASSPEQNDINISVEPFEHNGLAFEQVGFTSEGTKQTFYFAVENVSNNSVDINSNFAIINGDKRYAAEDDTYYSSELNPGMSANISVTFQMKSEDLTEGSPVLEIDRGFLLKDAITVELVRN